MAMNQDYAQDQNCREKKTSWETGGGNFQTTHDITLEVKFPELSTSRRCSARFQVWQGKVHRYEAIIVRRTMKDWKFTIDFERDLVHWDGLSVKMPKQPITKSDVQAYNAQQEVPRVIQEATNRQVQILNATYEKAHLPDSIPKHLTTVQQRTLLKILKNHEALFDGKLGTIRGVPPVDIVLKPGTIPVCVRPYPIPISKYAVGKNKVRRLESIGVLGMCNSRNETTSQWGVASIFIQKKKR
jgi:hypothetical protein